MQNKQALIGAVVLVLVIVGGAWYLSQHPTSSTSPTATSTTPTATTTSTTPVTPTTPTGTATPTAPAPTVYAVNSLPTSPKDTIVSWNIHGPYADGGPLQQKVEAQIANIQTQVDITSPSVQEKYISIAEEYELLGDGQNTYNYFILALNSKQRYEQEDGLAWDGLGQLMQRMGANYTAATAFANGVKADPGEPSFHVARINFLISYLPKETAMINAAFADADKDVPGNASVAQLQAQYKAQTQ